MSDKIVALADLGEITTKELAKKHKLQGLLANKKMVALGDNVAKVARDDFEKKLGESVITLEKNLNYEYVDDKQN